MCCLFKRIFVFIEKEEKHYYLRIKIAIVFNCYLNEHSFYSNNF